MSEPTNATIFIKDVLVIDPVEGFLGKRNIAILDHVIIKVSSANFEVCDNAKIIDAKDKYLIPGLWDAHVHFDYIPELASSMFDLFLLYGVTSVRDTGGRLEEVLEWKKKSLENPSKAPRVMIAGPLVDGSPSVYDGSHPSRPPLGVESATVEEARAKVRELATAGVDLIKAYEMLSAEQLQAVTDEARRHNLKVTGHVPLSMIHAAQRAYALDNQDAKATERVLASLKENDVWQIPTLSIMTAISKRQFLREDYRATFDLLPKEVGDGWKERSSVFGQSEVSESMEKYTSWFLAMTKRINDNDIPIMAGTDCPIFFFTA